MRNVLTASMLLLLGAVAAAQVTDKDARTKVFDWSVPLRVGGRSAQITGTPAEFQAYIQGEIARWAQVVKDAKIPKNRRSAAPVPAARTSSASRVGRGSGRRGSA